MYLDILVEKFRPFISYSSEQPVIPRESQGALTRMRGYKSLMGSASLITILSLTPAITDCSGGSGDGSGSPSPTEQNKAPTFVLGNPYQAMNIGDVLTYPLSNISDDKTSIDKLRYEIDPDGKGYFVFTPKPLLGGLSGVEVIFNSSGQKTVNVKITDEGGLSTTQSITQSINTPLITLGNLVYPVSAPEIQIPITVSKATFSSIAADFYFDPTYVQPATNPDGSIKFERGLGASAIYNVSYEIDSNGVKVPGKLVVAATLLPFEQRAFNDAITAVTIPLIPTGITGTFNVSTSNAVMMYNAGNVAPDTHPGTVTLTR